MIKTKKDRVMTLRMSSEDYELLQIAAYMTGMTPSKLLRMLADSSINAVKVQIAKGAINREDFKAVFND